MPVNKVRRRGSYAPLSAHYYKDDALLRAGEKAELLYVRALAFCADVLSDGEITDAQLAYVGLGLTTVRARARALVDVGLWERTGDGYRIRSWLGWNKSRDEILDEAEKDRGRKGARSPMPPEPPPEDDREDDAIPSDSERKQADSDRRPDGFQNVARGPARGSAPAPSNSRTAPGQGTSGGQLSGDGSRNVGSPARPPGRSNPERRPTAPCGIHPDDDRPCRRCQALRLERQQASTDEHRATVVASLPARRCGMCDAAGWLHEVGSALPVSPATRCDHETDHEQQVRAVREAG